MKPIERDPMGEATGFFGGGRTCRNAEIERFCECVQSPCTLPICPSPLLFPCGTTITVDRVGL